MTPTEFILKYRHILIPLALAVAGGYRSYRRTGTLSLKTLPWRAIQRLVLALRRSFWTVKKPTTATIDRPIEEVRAAMLANHFEDGWILSYHYQGEDANLRRPAALKNGKNRQTHVRLWDAGDGRTEVHAHKEYSPIQHPGLHIRNKELEVVTGQIAGAYSDGS